MRQDVTGTAGSSEAAGLWASVADVLRARIPSADFFSWFAMAEPVAIDGDAFTISFANSFAVQWVNTRFREALDQSVADVVGRPLTVRLVSRETPGAMYLEGAVAAREEAPALQAEPNPAPPAPDAPERITEEQLRAEIGRAAPAAGSAGSPAPAPDAPSRGLNDRYRFDTFVIGQGNQLAHAAALSVAEAPGQSYNPLFIYGGTGLGKTHLLHAIGHYAMESRPGTTVAYVTTEEFVNRFIQMIQRRDDSRARFKQYFRGIDVLLMDDVQLLSGKGAAMQEELFHTFNWLHESGRQVVLTSDREPGEIPKLEDRLRSRFAWGLITDIATPDVATRIAILRKKVQSDALDVPDEALTEIGEAIATNVRELEGALTRVVGFASLTGQPVTATLARQVLGSQVASSAPVTIARIQDVICQHFELSRTDLLGESRARKVSRPRQIGMYLARVMVGAASTEVARSFQRRDHSTVLHASKTIEKLIREDREVYDLVERLTATIREGERRVQQAR